MYEEGHGFPVVLLHGFPELAYSWRRQIPALAAAGFRAIAPDQRGYGLTDRPAAREAYDIVQLTSDLVGLLDAFGLEQAVFCGHDWGGLVAWSMPLLHPARTAAVIGVNTPFLPRPPVDPVTLLRQTRGEDHYIVFFQNPGEAEAIYENDVARSLRFIFRSTPKAVAPRVVTKGIAEKLATPEESWPGKLVLTEEELQVYIEAFSRTGFGPAIEWYRNLERNWRLTEDVEQRVRCPALMIAAENDPYLPPALSENMQRWVPDLERHVLAGCSHWTQSEQPDELNALLTDWLKRRFGDAG